MISLVGCSVIVVGDEIVYVPPNELGALMLFTSSAALTTTFPVPEGSKVMSAFEGELIVEPVNVMSPLPLLVM